ncbi:hypothetical protein RRG08_019003 [Elysia crispata]|uniref:Uncharacterized protein n=1 Tax=Elysia crispata TaxID=231223 RepID=A0AAE1A722_9GAST|nr:hypothetical protein RRG08_019003 [Elysia crispata]
MLGQLWTRTSSDVVAPRLLSGEKQAIAGHAHLTFLPVAPGLGHPHKQERVWPLDEGERFLIGWACVYTRNPGLFGDTHEQPKWTHRRTIWLGQLCSPMSPKFLCRPASLLSLTLDSAGRMCLPRGLSVASRGVQCRSRVDHQQLSVHPSTDRSWAQAAETAAS